MTAGFAGLLLAAALVAPAAALGAAPPEPAAPDAPVPPDPAPAPGSTAPDDTLGEVEIVGERPGPGLWRVVDGDRTLYVLGTLRPLPKKMKWRSREVEQVLERAQLVIPESPDVDADVGMVGAIRLYNQWRKVRKNPDGAPLAEVLPPDLYARFEALRTAYAPRKRDMLKRRPVLAAGQLWSEALSGAGLTFRIGVEEEVLRLAKRRKVPVADLEVKVEDPRGLLDELAAVPIDAEIACVAATLDRLEDDLANARRLAEAWATGDVEAIRASKVWAQQAACWDTLTRAPKLDEVRRRFDATWLDAAVQALGTHETTLAVAPLSALLRPDGVLDQFRRRGFEVVAP